MEDNGNDYSKILKIEPGIWSEIHATIQKNLDFFYNKKSMHLNQYIMSKFTSNYDLIPRTPFPITRFFVTMLSTFYSNSTRLTSMSEGQALEGLSEVSLRLALNVFQNRRFLNEASFIRIITGPELEFENIKETDIVYNFNFTKICIRKEQLEDETSIFEYYEFKNNKWWRIEFTAKDFYLAPYENMLEMTSEQKASMKATTPVSWKALPIIPFFANLDKYAYPSVFVAFDEVFNTLIAFGLAGAPMSLLVKIYVKNNSINKNKAKYQAFGDLLTLLELDKDDDAGKVDTGDITSLKNFFAVFEASLAWLGRMVGISVNVVSSQMNETRKSGSSKFVDNGSAEIFRSSYLSEFDEFEYRLFKACKALQPKMKDFKFQPIDKSNSKLLSDSDSFTDRLITEVRNMMTPYEEAIAKKYNVPLKDAKVIAGNIQKQFESYFPNGYNDGNSQKPQEESGTGAFGLKKGYLNDKNAKNIVEDD